MEFQAVIWQEDGAYVIKEAITGVTSQGKTIEEAIKNIKEAVSLYLEEVPKVRRGLKGVKRIGAVSVEIA